MEPRLISLLGHLDGVGALAFSPDGSVLATAGRDGTVQLWELPRGAPLRRLHLEGKWLGELAFSPDSGSLAIGGDPIRLWELATDQVSTIPHVSWSPLVFTADGASLVLAHLDSFEIIEVQSGRIVRQIPNERLEGYHYMHGSFPVSQNGEIGVLRTTTYRPSHSETHWFWDLRSGELLRKRRISSHLQVRQRHPLTGAFCWLPELVCSEYVALSPDGSRLAMAGTGSVWLCDMNTRRIRRLAQYSYERDCASLRFSADGETLAIGWYGGEVSALQLQQRRSFSFVSTRNVHGHSVACSTDGAMVAGGTPPSVWRIPSEERLFRLPGLGYEATEVLHARDGSWIRVGYSNGTVRRWNTGTGAVERLLRHQQLRESFQFTAPILSPDGTLEAKQGPGLPWKTGELQLDDETVELFQCEIVELFQRESVDLQRVETGDLIHRLDCDWFGSLAFSPDSTLFLAACHKWYVEVWSVETGERVERVDLYNGRITAVAGSPDNRLLAVAGRGGPLPTRWEDEDVVTAPAITLWNREARTELARFASLTLDVNALCFSPCGRRLASVGSDAALRIWEVPTGRLFATMHPLPCGEGGDGGWIVFTPEQFYDASPGSEGCFGWLTGTRLRSPAEYAATYHRPNAVVAALRGKAV